MISVLSLISVLVLALGDGKFLGTLDLPHRIGEGTAVFRYHKDYTLFCRLKATVGRFLEWRIFHVLGA